MNRFSRRDFLKTSLALTAGSFLSLSPVFQNAEVLNEKPNIIVLVLDAMSARNLSVYGYPRQTTPGLERIAERAMVYHSHYSAGNFTTSATASMLTGLYPWTHRGINLGGMVHKEFENKNIFSMMGSEYYCMAYTQNYLANILLGQFHSRINRHLPTFSFSENLERPLASQYFEKDPVAAYFALDDYLFSKGIKNVGNFPPVPIFALFDDLARRNENLNTVNPDYPHGLPNTSTFTYKNEVVYAGILEELLGLHKRQAPFLAYVHVFSPHEPYRPRREFIDIFPAIDLPLKQPTVFSTLDISNDNILQGRKNYDEYVANVDSEIEKLINGLQDAGALNNTYVFITADHGELFERGEYGHITRFLYDSVIHIPLLVITPDQNARRDIFTPTSNLDLMPTIIRLTGGTPAGNLQGSLLPGFGGGEEARAIFSMEAKECSSFGEFKQGATISLIRDEYKLIYYTGYRKRPDTFELYHLSEDPDEMEDLFLLDTSTASKMKEEVLDNFSTYRKPVS